MRLATFDTDDGPHLGVVDGDEVADVTAADARLGPDLGAVLDAGLLETVSGVVASAPRHPLAGVTLRSPVLRPPKFLAIGLNYALHVAESLTEKPKHQLWFNKQSTCAIGAGAPIHIPKASSMIDYEGELAFVIGRRCRHVPRARAHEVIAGYTVCNDVSVRDWQMRTQTMTMGKSFDTHGPLGPWVVTPDELGDPHALSLRTWVNDELRQDGTTDDLIYDCFDMVEHLTTAFTLEPGDVISTGTPAGVGMAMNPPGWLKAGDVVRIEIEGIGTLENPVIDEPDTATGLR
ncbi:MAG TPA: fumarylacetoacetate hydrolase family protein [Acidimicrobiales bacterium]|nr:fumarylacetoacetate hydrolase family protein [Acidimicrobiales bacterium]